MGDVMRRDGVRRKLRECAIFVERVATVLAGVVRMCRCECRCYSRSRTSCLCRANPQYSVKFVLAAT